MDTQRKTRRFLLAAGIAASVAGGLFSMPSTAGADGWPARPIKLIVPYSAGGPTDSIARLLAARMGESLGQPLVVENRAGAGGTIGVGATVSAPADGYTIALVAPGPLAGMPNLVKTAYAQDDIQYLTLVAKIPSVLVVSAKSGIGSIEDLLKAAKAQPERFTYSSAGPGTTPHIGMELLKDQAGISLLHVPYKGAAPALTAVLAGEVDATMVDLLPVLPHLANGTLKVLATAGSSRAPQLPDVPTMGERGLPGVLMETTYGLIGPKNLPAAVQDRLAKAAVAAVEASDMKEKFLQQGTLAVTSTPEAYRRLMQAESDKWRTIIGKAKISLN
jgi:tripartite-type tricarboxylate transporter receptor subunit TctC